MHARFGEHGSRAPCPAQPHVDTPDRGIGGDQVVFRGIGGDQGGRSESHSSIDCLGPTSCHSRPIPQILKPACTACPPEAPAGAPGSQEALHMVNPESQLLSASAFDTSLSSDW